ncbi:MAG: esterase-like activity of phytase family protein [Pseudomonas sp.]
MRRLCAALLLASPPVLADPLTASLEELALLAERPVAGMAAGNLSGLAWCNEALWAVSDREDGRLYRLENSADETVLQARAELFSAPAAPASRQPVGLRARTWLTNLVRGGELDFEGLSCDAQGNRYLVSEAHTAVLQLPVFGAPSWLALPSSLLRQARASGLLLQFNAGIEGVAVDPTGQRLWLAAERQSRGLLALHREQANWHCNGGCVLLSEGGQQAPPAQLDSRAQPRSFSALAFFDDKLFTLERQAYRICRRQPDTGVVERCWSFAGEALTEARRYDQPYGMAEALWLDNDGAWIGLDNGGHARADGEIRPIVWRFAAPETGWSSRL